MSGPTYGFKIRSRGCDPTPKGAKITSDNHATKLPDWKKQMIILFNPIVTGLNCPLGKDSQRQQSVATGGPMCTRTETPPPAPIVISPAPDKGPPNTPYQATLESPGND